MNAVMAYLRYYPVTFLNGLRKTQSTPARIAGFRIETQTTNFQIRSTDWRRPAAIFKGRDNRLSLFSYDFSELELRWDDDHDCRVHEDFEGDCLGSF
jgi:hypothetical protein